MNTIDVHQLSITGSDHQQADHTFVLKGKLASAGPAKLIFEGVAWWELCSFGIENVLISIDVHAREDLTNAIINEYDIPEPYGQLVQTGRHSLYMLKEQVGLLGWIIADNMRLNTD